MSATVEQASIALGEATRLAEAGYKLTPVTITRATSGKKAAKFHGNGLAGKAFRGWRHEDAWSADPQMIRQWWIDHPGTSFALGCAVNGIEGVDLDVKPELGVDAVAWWATEGLPISAFEQRTPSGGAHFIWRVRADGRTLPQEAGKSFGKGVDTRNRAGLFFAAGGYVVDEPGHYELLGTLPALHELDETPLDVVALFAEAGERERPDRATDGRIVIHDEHWQRAQTGLALQNIRDHDRSAGGYRAKLQHAGLFYGRAVEQGFLTEEQAGERILEAHRSVWGPAVWPENAKDIRDALADGPRLERWRVPADPGPRSSTNGSTLTVPGQRVSGFFFDDEPEEAGDPASAPAALPAAPPVQPAPDGMSDEDAAQFLEYRRELDREKRQQRIRRAAREELAAEEREPLQILDADDFLDAPTPEYLVPRMLYRDGLAVVFGPPGAAKSFLVLDIALSLATGTPWRGRLLGRGKVHYVMAEGQATNVMRTKAWLHHRDVDRAELKGWFRAIPTAVMLTEPGIVDYLPIVQADQPDLIILDTKNLMFAGKESQGDDYGAMLRVLHRLRQAAGGAAVVLIDHSGLTDDSRTRGSNAQKGGVETEIRVVEENGVRRAEVSRDKSGASGHEWLYRLVQVDEVPRALDVDAPAVCVPLERSELAASSPFGTELEDWNDPAQPELPGDVGGYGGVGQAAVRPLARFMRYSAPEDSIGFSLADARKAVKVKYVNEKGRPKFSDDTIDRAWNALVKLKRLVSADGGKETSRSVWVAMPGDPS